MDRLALVIGNANYTFANPLNNPINDARDIGDILREYVARNWAPRPRKFSSGVGENEHLRRSWCALSSHKVRSGVGMIEQQKISR